MSYTLPTEKEKPQFLAKEFSKIAKSYDLFNTLSTFGLHKLWKKRMVSYVAKYIAGTFSKDALHLADLLCGTGDLAFLLSNEFSTIKNEKVFITGLDISSGMLEVAQKKKKLLKQDNLNFVEKSINDLKEAFKPHSVNAITMGFGLRNVPNIDTCLKDIFSVLKVKGVFVHIDLGTIGNPVLRFFSELYFFKLVPVIGRLLNNESTQFYSYLPHSNKKYVTASELTQKLKNAGFVNIQEKKYVFGQVVRHIAIKDGRK